MYKYFSFTGPANFTNFYSASYSVWGVEAFFRG